MVLVNKKMHDQSNSVKKEYPSKREGLELNDIISFGKYKEKTIGFIIENNRNYLSWALENVNEFRLADDAMKLLNENKSLL